MSELQPSLGDELRSLRAARGLSLAEAARRAAVSPSALGNWEAGRRIPGGAALDGLLGALGATVRRRAGLLALGDPAYARNALATHLLGAPLDRGAVLRAMRRRQGLSQAALAREVGVAQGTVAKWEAGDSFPSPEGLHAVCFAIRAGAEEMAALAMASEARAGDLEERVRALRRGSPELHEVRMLGLEAELWPLAARDPKWDGFLAYVRANRAHYMLCLGRFGEVEAPAAAAMRLGLRGGNADQAVGAAYALTESRRRQGGGSERTFALFDRVLPQLRENRTKAWVMALKALALARNGAIDDALRLGRRAVDLIEARSEDEDGMEAALRRVDLAVLHLAADEPERVLGLTEGNGTVEASSVRARALLALGVEPDEGLVEPLRERAKARPIWLYAEELEAVERPLRRFRRRRERRAPDGRASSVE